MIKNVLRFLLGFVFLCIVVAVIVAAVKIPGQAVSAKQKSMPTLAILATPEYSAPAVEQDVATVEPTQTRPNYAATESVLGMTQTALSGLQTGATMTGQAYSLIVAAHTASHYATESAFRADEMTARPPQMTQLSVRSTANAADVATQNAIVVMEIQATENYPKVLRAKVDAENRAKYGWVDILSIIAFRVMVCVGILAGSYHLITLAWLWTEQAKAERAEAQDEQQGPGRISNERPLTREGDTFLADVNPPGDKEKFRAFADWAILGKPLGKESHKLFVRIYSAAEYVPVWSWLKYDRKEWLVPEDETRNNEMVLNAVGILKFRDWCVWYDGAETYVPLKDWSSAAQTPSPLDEDAPNSPPPQDGKPSDGIIDGGGGSVIRN